MKNISGNKKDSYEEAWQNAFEGKEMNTSPELWQRLDKHLAVQESKKYHRGMIFYKIIAAASISLALVVSGVLMYNYFYPDNNALSKQVGNQQIEGGVSENQTVDQQNNAIGQKEITSNEDQDQAVADDINNNLAENKQNNTIKATPNGQEIENAGLNDVSGNLAEQKSGKGQDTANNNGGENLGNENPIQKDISNTLAIHVGNNEVVDGDVVGENDKKIAGEVDPDNPANQQANMDNMASNISQQPEAGTMVLVEGSDESLAVYSQVGKGPYLSSPALPGQRIFIQKVINFADDPFKKNKKESPDGGLWAGIDMSSGVFNPNFSSSDNLQASPISNDNNNLSARNYDGFQENSIGQSFSFGINLGTQLSEKWIIQSGINIMNYNTNGNTNSFYESSQTTKTPALNYYNAGSESQNVNLGPGVIYYENRLDYVSIPLKAGYILVDKKIDIILSAGMSTDFLYRNKISSKTSGIEDFTVRPGEDTPYRSVNFNGLLGTQFRYQLGDHYSFTLDPAFTFGFNSLIKSDFGVDNYPNVFRMGVGIKYIFSNK